NPESARESHVAGRRSTVGRHADQLEYLLRHRRADTYNSEQSGKSAWYSRRGTIKYWSIEPSVRQFCPSSRWAWEGKSRSLYDQLYVYAWHVTALHHLIHLPLHIDRAGRCVGDLEFVQ